MTQWYTIFSANIINSTCSLKLQIVPIVVSGIGFRKHQYKTSSSLMQRFRKMMSCIVTQIARQRHPITKLVKWDSLSFPLPILIRVKHKSSLDDVMNDDLVGSWNGTLRWPSSEKETQKLHTLIICDAPVHTSTKRIKERGTYLFRWRKIRMKGKRHKKQCLLRKFTIYE